MEIPLHRHEMQINIVSLYEVWVSVSFGLEYA